MKIKNGKVGPFFFIQNKVHSDAMDIDRAEDYGEFKTWGSHWQFWDKLVASNYEFAELEYVYFPRGRVTYNYVKDIYYIYLNPKLNRESIIEQIVEEFELTDLHYTVDDTDEHYRS